MSKLEKIIDLVKKAGFICLGEGKGIYDLEGIKSFLYQKTSMSDTKFSKQLIQLSVFSNSDETPKVIYSVNVGDKIRHEIDSILNGNDMDYQTEESPLYSIV